MPSRKFPKEFLRDDILNEGAYIERRIIDTSRWSIMYEMVFEFEGKFYETYYSEGATEMQDESPYEYDDDEIDCVEVEPIQVMVTKYEAVKD